MTNWRRCDTSSLDSGYGKRSSGAVPGTLPAAPGWGTPPIQWSPATWASYGPRWARNQRTKAPTPPFDVRAPNIARVYNYWLGGKDHYAADRKAGGSVLDDFPEVALVAHANREFVTRAVRDGQPWAASRQSLRMRGARCSYVGIRKSRKTDTLSVRCWAACR